MKLKLLLLALFVAGLAGALALATPSGADTGTTTTGTTTTSKHGKKEHGDKPKCSHVELKGTAASSSIAITVTRGSKHADALVGKQVSLSVAGDVSVNAVTCDGGKTFQLAELKVKNKHDDHPETTTGTTTQ